MRHRAIRPFAEALARVTDLSIWVFKLIVFGVGLGAAEAHEAALLQTLTGVSP